jgi:glycosyltransferase involved in cell wall biosynthesis
MPKISVVIPSYNHAAFITEAVNSVLNQSEPDLELIVVDDGSTDRSLSVLSGFSDSRLRVFSQTNQGAHAAINRGLREASGNYLAILNSDDAYHPNRLEKMVRLLKANPLVGLAGSYIEIMDVQGKGSGVKHGYEDCPPWILDHAERSFRAGGDLRAALLTENYLATTSNYVFPRPWYERVGGFRPLRYTHDWDFALRMARVAQLALLPEPLVRYRVHPANTIRENQAAMIFEICWILAVHLPNHVSDPSFLNEIPLEDRIGRLLHSIYTYRVDRVLNVMLIQRLHEDDEQALSLLKTDNPVRRKYLEFISDKLAEGEGATSQDAAQIGGGQAFWKTNIKRFLAPLKTFIKKVLH